MKLFAIVWFTHLIFVDITSCDRNSEGSYEIREKPSEYTEYFRQKTPLMKSMTLQNILRRFKQPRSNCFFADDNDLNCVLQKYDINQQNTKAGKNNVDSNSINLLRAKQKLLMTNPIDEHENSENNSSKTEQELSLTAEEPRYVIIRKEREFPLKLDSRNFWEFIPPRGRKGYIDLNDVDTFIPNRGKKDSMEWRDKKVKQNLIAFELNDDFYPVRGRRQQALYDEDLFYPNRGKRSLRAVSLQ